MSVNLFDTRTMIEVVQEGRKDNPTVLRDTFFRTRKNYDTEWIDFDVVGKNGRKIAPFVHPKIGGKAVDRGSYRTMSYKAPEVAPEIVTTPVLATYKLPPLPPDTPPLMTTLEIVSFLLSTLVSWVMYILPPWLSAVPPKTVPPVTETSGLFRL